MHGNEVEIGINVKNRFGDHNLIYLETNKLKKNTKYITFFLGSFI